MQSCIFPEPLDYDGSQLHHAFAYEKANILGDSIVSFIGSANVKEHLVDLEDSLANDFISSDQMIHYIIELFGANITETVLWQRVLVKEIIDNLCQGSHAHFWQFSRKGDDVMYLLPSIKFSEASTLHKMSVSIATLSHFSGLIHLGINIKVGENCPVAAIGLKDLGYNDSDIVKFQEDTVNLFVKEYESVKKATYKVRGL